MIDGAAVAERVSAVRAKLAAAARAAGREPEGVRLVAVTKGFGADAIDAAVAAGCTAIGENYAQELIAKLPDIAVERPEVHFIGHLQSNKVRQLAPFVDCWQTVDRASLGPVLARHAPGGRVLVQVNVSGAPQQGGCAPADTAALVGELRALGLAVEGLMAIGAVGGPEVARPGFALLKRQCDELGLSECSMGMTDDYEAAVAEGATIVRLGSALFGARPRPPEAAQYPDPASRRRR